MKRILVLIGVFSFLMTGCKKGWLQELANNPNNPSEAPLDLIMPAVLTGLAANEVALNTRAGVWMGYASFSGGYSINDNDLTYWVQQGSPSIWGYWTQIRNADYIVSRAVEEGEGNTYFVAVGKILKAYGMQKIVDAYGDVPYSEAFQGSDNFFPKYDDAKSIYEANIAELNDAIDLIKGANPANEKSIASNDILFKGKMDNWIKFANTIKLRYLVRAGNAISGSIDASLGFIDSETGDANVNPGYLNDIGKQTPLWTSFATDPGGALYSDGWAFLKAGGALVNFLKNNDDPRLFYIYEQVGVSPSDRDFFDIVEDPDEYEGVYYGDRDAASSIGASNVSTIGSGILKGPTADAVLISAAQSYFLQAEAVLNGLISSGDAEELYNSGVIESFKTLGVGDAVTKANDYLANGGDLVNWGESSDKQKTISVQKWISLAYVGSIESWTEQRRTGFPGTDILPLTKFGQSGRHIPTKFWYPSSESDRNQQNYIAAGGADTDPQNQKIFWDNN